MHTTAYIDQALIPYFGSMINFIQSVEKHDMNEAAELNEGMLHMGFIYFSQFIGLTSICGTVDQ